MMKDIIASDQSNNTFFPIPDWETSSLFLIWPQGIKGRNLLVPVYRELLTHVPDDIDINIIVKDISYSKGITDMIAPKRSTDNIVFHEISMVSDIWIRDWAPVPIKHDMNYSFLVKAKYNPRYLQDKYPEYAVADHNAGFALAKKLNLALFDMPVIWDIGNFTHNGMGLAIVTRRILDDNKDSDITEKNIQQIFYDRLGIERLVIIEEEPGDATGHIDGTVRFLNEKTLAVARYPDEYNTENQFCDNLAKNLEYLLGNEFSIIRLPNGPIDERMIEGIPSAVGNHLNFLRIGNYLFMPCYGIKEDDHAIGILKEACLGIEIVTIRSKEIIKLAQRGGVLNCISWGV